MSSSMLENGKLNSLSFSSFCVLVSAVLLTPPVQAQSKKDPRQEVKPTPSVDLKTMPQVEGVRFRIPTHTQASLFASYRDESALKATLENILRRRPNPRNTLVDPQFTKLGKMGLDVQALREMMEFLQNGAFEVGSVSFLPDATGQGVPPSLILPYGDDLSFSGGDFAAGIPSKGSLAGSMTFFIYRRTPNQSTGEQTGGGRHVHVGYSDGSQYFDTTSTDAKGNKVWQYVVINGDNEVVVSHSETMTATGEAIQVDHSENSEAAPSEAEEAHEQLLSGEQGQADAEELQDREQALDTGDDEVGGYQPSDGMGTLCPMSLDICRRNRERALSGGQAIKTGHIIVAPAEPDNGTTNATRLRYNPRNLVINPNPNAGPETGQVRSHWRIVLPVIDNPPAPND